MPLSPNARVLSGAGIQQSGRQNGDIIAIVEATNTVGIGPDELLFPDQGVTYLDPGFGRVAFKVESSQEEWWVAPRFCVLSLEVIKVPLRRVNLVAVALIPSNGCQMDVTTSRN
jgi:hypothetical protein